MRTRFFIASLAIAAAAGCARESEHADKVGREFVVHRLFTHEGCTVYRFMDAGHYVYYSHCPRAQSSAQYHEAINAGKTVYFVRQQSTTESD